MIFMGQGRPEQGHNAIAQHLVHGPLVAVHGVHHACRAGIEELLGRFGIEVRESVPSSLSGRQTAR